MKSLINCHVNTHTHNETFGTLWCKQKKTKKKKKQQQQQPYPIYILIYDDDDIGG